MNAPLSWPLDPQGNSATKQSYQGYREEFFNRKVEGWVDSRVERSASVAGWTAMTPNK